MTTPEAKLLSSLLAADSYADATEHLRAAAVPLDPNFCEGLAQTVHRAEQERDPDARRWRRVYDLVQEYRYRNPRLDRFAPEPARGFVLALAAQASEDEMLRFIEANVESIDANVIGALRSYRDFAESPDAETAQRLYTLSSFLIEQHALRGTYTPPSGHQGFLAALYKAFQRREMLGVLEQGKDELGLPLAYVIVFTCDELLRAGQLTDEFVYFVKALAMHLTNEEIGGTGFVEVGAYLWEFILTLYDPRKHSGDYALALYNVALAELKRGRTGTAKGHLEKWLELPLEDPEARLDVVSRLGRVIEREADETGGAEAYREAARWYREQGLERLPAGHQKWFECAFLLAENILSNRGRTLEELNQAQELLEKCNKAWAGTDSPQLPAVLDLLAAVRLERPGDRSENVEAAIGLLERALAGIEAAASEARSQAIVHNRLGHAYRLRIAGDPVENIDSAVHCFRRAAEICPADTDLDEHLRSITNLAMVLGRSDELADVREAIGLIDSCLEHDTPEARPLLYAADLLEKANLQMQAAGLGAEGEREAALASLEMALEVPAVAEDAVLRAGLLTNQAALVLEMPEAVAEAGEMLRKAVEAAEATGIQRLVAGARFHLGRYTESQGDRETALEHYRAAIEASEAELGSESSREHVLHVERFTGEVYEAVVALLVDLERHEEALDYLERNKARSLRQMIQARTVKPSPGVSAALAREYEELSERKRHLETRTRLLRFGRRPASRELAEVQRLRPEVDRVHRAADVEVMTNQAQLATLQPALDDVLRRIRETDPDFTPTPGWSKLSREEIEGLVGEGSAVIELMVARRGVYIFVMARDAAGALTIRVFSRPQANRSALESMVREEWLEPYHRYRHALLEGAAGSRKLRQAWRAAIEQIGSSLASMLEFDEVEAWLSEVGATSIVLVPYQVLHVLPLHLLRGGKRYLCERFEISYAPSLRLLGHCRTITGRGRSDAFVVNNPDGSLVFSGLEVRLIEQLLGEPAVLAGEACSWRSVQAGISDCELFHYSGHAYFDLRNPLASALVLADRRLTLGEILATSRLPRGSMVVLSACETNQVGYALPGDEYSGLPGGFLYAGAPTVVGSLWLVEDNSAPLFMQAFYRSFITSGSDVGEAFSAATRELRTITAGEILERFAEPDAGDDPGLARLLAYCETKDPAEPIFDHPEYWAAFNLVGSS